MTEDFLEGIDFYFNESGWIVLTEKYHLDRGFCCGNGCRHCPFNFENVPEPKRTSLRKIEENNRDNPSEGTPKKPL